MIWFLAGFAAVIALWVIAYFNEKGGWLSPGPINDTINEFSLYPSTLTPLPCNHHVSYMAKVDGNLHCNKCGETWYDKTKTKPKETPLGNYNPNSAGWNKYYDEVEKSYYNIKTIKTLKENTPFYGNKTTANVFMAEDETEMPVALPVNNTPKQEPPIYVEPHGRKFRDV